jgi:hypothetical protein
MFVFDEFPLKPHLSWKFFMILCVFYFMTKLTIVLFKVFTFYVFFLFF